MTLLAFPVAVASRIHVASLHRVRLAVVKGQRCNRVKEQLRGAGSCAREKKGCGGCERTKNKHIKKKGEENSHKPAVDNTHRRAL